MAILSISNAKAAARSAYGRTTASKRASNLLREQFDPSPPYDTQFDVFLSHSYADARIDSETLLGILELLQDEGISVYVDWIVDRRLSRNHVTPGTARVLRRRMDSSECLLFATSTNSADSKWMPWELGYMDGNSGRVAILPLTGGTAFRGQEYLGLYPYIDFDDDDGALWVNRSPSRYIGFWDWLNGNDPH